MDKEELAERIAKWLDQQPDISSAAVLPEEKHVIGVDSEAGTDEFFIEVNDA